MTGHHRTAGIAGRTWRRGSRLAYAGLIVTQSGPAIFHREHITTLAARHRLPAVYSLRHDVMAGGLMAYGPDSIEPYRRAAGYVDRILKGEKPGDLPVQAATKFELIINLKTGCQQEPVSLT